MLFVFIMGLCGCEQRPNTNSEECLKLHGVVNGEKNTVQIGDHLFVIPEKYRITVKTYGQIQSGRADVLKFWMDFSDLFPEWTGQTSKVRVEVRSLMEINYEQTPVPTDRDYQEFGNDPVRGYAGLIELPTGDSNGGWSYKKYVALFEKNEFKIGNVKLNCSGTERIGSSTCWGGFVHKGLSVWFFLNSRILPKWKVVIPEISKQIDSMIRE